MKNASWYSRLFQDSIFLNIVKDHFEVFFSNKQLLLDYIDTQAAALVDKVVEDNKVWGRITTTAASDSQVKIEYQEKVDRLKMWITKRLNWLHASFNSL